MCVCVVEVPQVRAQISSTVASCSVLVLHPACGVQDSGSIRWKWSCPKPVFSSPALLVTHNIAFGSVDGECYVISSRGELVRKRAKCVV